MWPTAMDGGEMDFIDWCHVVLQAITRLHRSDPAAREVGMYDLQLVRAIFGQGPTTDEYDPTAEQTLAIHDVLEALVRCRVLEEKRKRWHITSVGQSVLEDPVKFWASICAIQLDDDQRDLLAVVNRLSPLNKDGYARVNHVDHATITSAATTIMERGLLFPVASELRKLGLTVDHGGMSNVTLKATYTGLVWEQKRGFTLESKMIDELVAEWETTSGSRRN